MSCSDIGSQTQSGNLKFLTKYISRASKSSSFWTLLLLVSILLSEVAHSEYLWPLPYGKELSSSFGDWRTRHYHAGLDVRTGGKIGLPVLAPADGYVMRISMAYYGYGKALYFQMVDGKVAVFGHLDHFRPEVEKYVQERQIKSESYNQNIFLDATQFRYHRGDTICYSGQTGVGAPHLHFEVRTPENTPLNPLGFDGLKQTDTEAPEFRRLHLIGNWNEELERALGHKLDYSFVKKPRSSEYVLNDTLECDGFDFWLSVEAIDHMDTSPWIRSIYSLELRQGSQLLYQMTYDSLSFDNTYLVDMERNFQMAIHGATDFHNLVSYKQADEGTGLCREGGDQVYTLTLVARDIAGNESRAVVPVRKVNHDPWKLSTKPDFARLAALSDKLGTAHGDLTLSFIPAGNRLYSLIRTLKPHANGLSFTSARRSVAESGGFTDLGGGYWLGLVDSVGGKDYLSGGETLYVYWSLKSTDGSSQQDSIKTDFRRAWLSNDKAKGNVVSADGRLAVTLPPLADACFPLDRQYYYEIETGKGSNALSYTLIPNDFPFAKQVTFAYKFDTTIPRGAALYLGSSNQLSWLGNDMDSAAVAVTAKSYRPGTVIMRIDTIPPTIRQVVPASKASVMSVRPTIRCKVNDNLSGVRDSFEVRIDGRWCIPVYDPEASTLTSTPYFDLSAGKHLLDIRVTDRCGNQRRVTSEFNVGAANRPVKSAKKHK